uniref:Zgc:174906 n=1 Tax=Xiphophorus couchianus TaxID=32473 RepID=A0A3B5LR75_9TELE
MSSIIYPLDRSAMAEEATNVVHLLKGQKAALIEILRADADFVVQSAHSLYLVSDQGYEKIKSCRVPSEKVQELLDHVIMSGPKAAQGMLDLLKEKRMQETFPMLDFVKDLRVKTPLSGCVMVREKQLMIVAKGLGSSWREIGRLALGITNVTLEQIEEEKRTYTERVFAMLYYWRNQKREEATAAYLHSLLSQKVLAVPPESIECLLETD